MQVEVDDINKLVIFWLTQTEQKETNTIQNIRSCSSGYKAQKYTVAVFCSGKKDLAHLATELILQNRNITNGNSGAQSPCQPTS